LNLFFFLKKKKRCRR